MSEKIVKPELALQNCYINNKCKRKSYLDTSEAFQTWHHVGSVQALGGQPDLCYATPPLHHGY